MSSVSPVHRAADLLLEREDALAALHGAYAEATAGSGRLVLLGGEAGVGKTALVRQFCAERPRSRVLWGACDPLFTPRPLGPLADVAQVTGGALHDIVQEGAIPYRVADALMGELRAQSPVVLVLDDMHWADEATLDVFRLLARRIETLPALVVATYRDDELDAVHPLRVALGGLAAAKAIQRVPVAPLSLAAVARLAEGAELDADALYRMTAGNPFFVTEVLAAGTGEIPETVRDAVLARAASLNQAARDVLEAVAIVPPETELWLLERLAPHSDGELAECVASGMLSMGDSSVAFRHELARLAIEESLLPNRRVSLHQLALAALESEPADARDPSRLAHHAEAAGDTEAVLRSAPAAAARASSLGAHREAAAQYARAIRSSGDAPLERRAALLESFSSECYLTDKTDEAIDALRDAVECYRQLGDRLREGDALRAVSNTLWCPGRSSEARRVGFEAVGLLEQLPPGRELAHAYGNLSFLYRMAAEFDESRRWGDRALELAEQLGDAEVLASALIAVGTRELASGLPEGRRKLEWSLELAESAGLHELVGDALIGFALATMHRKDYVLASRYIARGLTYSREHGLELSHHYLLAFRARLELDQGRWTEAADAAELVVGEYFVSTYPRTLGLVVIALVRARRGDPDVWPLLDEALALARPTGEFLRIGPVAAARAETAWLTGRPRAVQKETEAALTLAPRRGGSAIVAELAMWRRRSGIKEPVPHGAAEPHALQLAGDCQAAAAAWVRLGCPYETALALLGAGDEEALRRGLDICHGLGARPLATMIARRLRERGARNIPRGPRRAARESPAGLTARELEVLKLIADGLRNADIAERLFVSRRTVDHHVSAILRKLGARTRGAATVEAARLGLIEAR